MVIERKVGEKGQVVIPKDIRKFLGLKMGKKIIFEFRGDEVVLRGADPRTFLDEFLNVPKRLRRGLTMHDVKKTLGETY